MEVFDKISWHLDAGEDIKENIQRFEVIFDYLNLHNMLSADGKEVLELGIDRESSLHSKLLTDNGLLFCEKYEDMIVGIDAKTLKILLSAADYEEYREYVQNIISFILRYGDKYNAEAVKEIYSTRDKINLDIQKLSPTEIEHRNLLESLGNIVVGHPKIRMKMGK